MTNTEAPKKDLLGLERLGLVIDEAREASNANGVERIAAVFEAVMSNYSVLRDRYRLLKESNRLLAEEVAWLRDQCDDFAVERSELALLLAGQPLKEAEEEER